MRGCGRGSRAPTRRGGGRVLAGEVGGEHTLLLARRAVPGAPPGEADEEAEVCVIGAGVAGLSCALQLARAASRRWSSSATRLPPGRAGETAGFLLAGMAAFHVDARERYGASGRRGYARTLAAQGRSTRWPRSSARAKRCAAPACCGRPRPRRRPTTCAARRRAARRRLPGASCVERDELPAALRRARERLPDRPRRRPAPGALDPRARARRRAGRRAHPGAQPRRGAGRPARRAHGRRHARARDVVVAADGALPRSCRATTRARHAAPAHGRQRPARGEHHRRPVYSRWGYEYLQQTPDGRVLAGGFSDLDGEGPIPTATTAARRLAAHRALPRRRPGRGRAGDPSLGRARRVQRDGPPFVARCQTRAYTSRAATRARERAGLRRRPAARRCDRRLEPLPRRPLAGVVRNWRSSWICCCTWSASTGGTSLPLSLEASRAIPTAAIAASTSSSAKKVASLRRVAALRSARASGSGARVAAAPARRRGVRGARQRARGRGGVERARGVARATAGAAA